MFTCPRLTFCETSCIVLYTAHLAPLNVIILSAVHCILHTLHVFLTLFLLHFFLFEPHFVRFTKFTSDGVHSCTRRCLRFYSDSLLHSYSFRLCHILTFLTPSQPELLSHVTVRIHILTYFTHHTCSFSFFQFFHSFSISLSQFHLNAASWIFQLFSLLCSFKYLIAVSDISLLHFFTLHFFTLPLCRVSGVTMASLPLLHLPFLLPFCVSSCCFLLSSIFFLFPSSPLYLLSLSRSSSALTISVFRFGCYLACTLCTSSVHTCLQHLSQTHQRAGVGSRLPRKRLHKSRKQEPM